MRQQQHMKIDNSFAMKLWLYMSRPFQITKVLELLYMLDWIWYAILSYLPGKYISGSLFTNLRAILTPDQITGVMTCIALIHVIALYKNVIWLRKFNLLFNISLLLYLTGYLLQYIPVAAGIGYYIILIGVSTFAFWRMDETH
jgi:hypothetical protein